LPRELIESELFGYRRGAFSGATTEYQELFRAAEGGALFLDEVTEMASDTQAKLLRV
jgi:transcriptional regulator with GAF, ATPase, and Fis domain